MTMDYEEKYKEALERAKDYIDGHHTDVNPQKAMEYIFPELRESEDERIRKELISFITDRKNWFPKEETKSSWITWLEKQGKEDERYNYLEELLDADNIYQMSMNEAMVEEAKSKAVNALSKLEISKLLSLEKQGEQNTTDEVKPKFRVGDFITDGKRIFQIKETIWERNNRNDGSTYCESLIVNLRDGNTYADDTDLKEYHLWTIQDAKDGDVLAYVTDEEDLWIMIYWSLYEPYEGHVHYHALLVNDNFSNKGTCCICIEDLKPATKEQRKLLFKKMKEAGYEWNAEKKELKKIEQRFYHNDGLYYAIDILEKTFGKVEGYQTDDGKMEHQIAIETVNALYHKKPAEWSEEDKEMLKDIISGLKAQKSLTFAHDNQGNAQMNARIDWLQSLPEKFVLEPKQEWSEEDDYVIQRLFCLLDNEQDNYQQLSCSFQEIQEFKDWLESLKPNHWKPSEYDISLLEEIARNIRHNVRPFCSEVSSLENLIDNLKKL